MGAGRGPDGGERAERGEDNWAFSKGCEPSLLSPAPAAAAEREHHTQSISLSLSPSLHLSYFFCFSMSLSAPVSLYLFILSLPLLSLCTLIFFRAHTHTLTHTHSETHRDTQTCVLFSSFFSLSSPSLFSCFQLHLFYPLFPGSLLLSFPLISHSLALSICIFFSVVYSEWTEWRVCVNC